MLPIMLVDILNEASESIVKGTNYHSNMFFQLGQKATMPGYCYGSSYVSYRSEGSQNELFLCQARCRQDFVGQMGLGFKLCVTPAMMFSPCLS